MAEDYRAMARAAAERHGVPAEMFVNQIAQESGFRPDAASPAGALGLAQIVPEFHPTVDPLDPPAALDYAAAWMAALRQQFGSWALALAAYNSGPGNVQRHGGVPPFAETRRYLTRILGDGWPEPEGTPGAPESPATAPYDPDTPPERQVQDWSCSIRVTCWMLKSIGIPVEAGELQVRMQAAGLVSPALGLHDGSGAALAAWLSTEFGVRAWNAYPTDWASVADLAGDCPVGLGSGGYYHWLAVRDAHADGTLRLMNPAPNWRDIGETLTPAEWARGEPWALLWIEVDAPAEEMDDMAIAAEQARIALEAVLPDIDKALSYDLPEEAREALQFGARPATQTIIRNGGLEAPE